MKKDCLHCQHGDYQSAQFNAPQRQAHIMRCSVEKWRYVRVNLGCQNKRFQAADNEKIQQRIAFVQKYAPELLRD